MQPREWLMLVLLIAIPLAIAVVVTLWSIKQMAYTPKRPSRPKPVLSAEDLARLAGNGSESGATTGAGASSNDHPDALPVPTAPRRSKAETDGTRSGKGTATRTRSGSV